MELPVLQTKHIIVGILVKIKSKCLYCLFFRAKKQIERLTVNEEIRYNALTGVIQIIADHVGFNASNNISHPLRLCPSYIGTKRDRFLQKFFQVNDTYKPEKQNLKSQTSILWNMVQKKIKRKHPEEQLKLALASATSANIIEYDLLNQKNGFNIRNLKTIINSAEKKWDNLSIKLLPSLISEITEANSILYLTDNVGEVIFDALVIDLLIQQDKKVIVAGKSEPILNDATVIDLQDLWVELRTNDSPEIISIGTNSVGLLIDEISDEFRKILSKSDLIIAKGMGHFETLPEYEWNQSVWCLFRTKCEPVAIEAKSEIDLNCIRKIS
ncbi:MAG: DUF89 family protein [Candidatus Heimdallarchaeota archaeon]|nr:MAG: DUF89 family protein [Candidatus Heimdallarchaeota archaeon]